MVDGRQAGDVADQFVEESGFNQISFFRDEGLLGQHHLLGGSGVSGEKTPVNVASVAEIRVVGILCSQGENLG